MAAIGGGILLILAAVFAGGGKGPKEPVTCKGCGKVKRHCICNDLDKAKKEVVELLKKYKHKKD